MKRMHFALGAAAAVAAAAPALSQDLVNIGLASAAKNEVIVVGEKTRGLKAGDTIFQNQHIRTGRDSAAQLLFRDETALTMGPNSSLVLDKAVYDPEKHTGEISVRAVSGAFRFISGSSPTGSYSINTPAGTVGIRGTWVAMLIQGENIRLIVRDGLVTFCNAARQCMRVLPGYEIRAMKDRIGPPTKVSHETLESIVALWFNENSEANLGKLEPGAGQNQADNGPNYSGKSFWWLDAANRGTDFQPQFTSLPNNPNPPDDGMGPGDGDGPNVHRLRQKARAALRRTIWGLVAFAHKKGIDTPAERRTVIRELRPEVRALRQQIPQIDNRQELKDFRRDLKDFRKDAKKVIRCTAHPNRPACSGGD